MVLLKADIGDDLSNYVNSLIDDEVILTRSGAIRQIIIEHRDKIKKVKK